MDNGEGDRDRGDATAAPARRSGWIRVKPILTAIIAGGAAGAIALLTYQAMLALQHVIWETGAADSGPGAVRIVLTILLGGAVLILLGRIAPSETMEELLRDSDDPRGRSWRRILTTALAGIVSIGFGGAVGPEAGLLAVVAECSIIVSRFIARDTAQARAVAKAGNAGVLGGLYGSPPAAATLDDDAPPATRAMSFLAGIAGFATFLLLSRTVFGGTGVATIALPEPGPEAPGAEWLVIVPVLAAGLLGLAFRTMHGVAEGLVARVRRRWIVTAVGTALFAALAAWIPLVRFSGHHELLAVTDLFSQGEVGALTLLAVAKLLATVLCLVAGWRGGEVFPLIFIGAAVGGATALLIPALDPASAMAGAMAAALTVGWRRPVAALFVLVLVIDTPVALPLLAGTAVGLIVDRLLVRSRVSSSAGSEAPDAGATR